MTETPLSHLLEDVIDYAGLFPPTSLPLEAAFENFVDYQERPEKWMLARFIVPAARLSELSDLMDAGPRPLHLRFAVLGRKEARRSEFLAALESDLDAVKEFQKRHPDARVEVFEVTIPAEELDYQIRADALLKDACQRISRLALSSFFEVPRDDVQWKERSGRLLRALQQGACGKAGYKLRTGGVIPEAFPPAGDVAWAIAAARDHGVTIKFTAGLHHPIRHYSEEVGADMHGFINVFVAVALAEAHNLSAKELIPVLEERASEAFQETEDGLIWRGLTISSAVIASARGRAPSFGSCSFDEPCQDLRSLNRLPQKGS